MAHLTDSSISTPFSLLTGSSTLAHTATTPSAHPGLREWGTCHCWVTWEPLYSSGQGSEKDIADFPRGGRAWGGPKTLEAEEAARRATPSGQSRRTQERQRRRRGGAEPREGLAPPCALVLPTAAWNLAGFAWECPRRKWPVVAERTFPTAWENSECSKKKLQ